jgi:hypothetical protein
MRVDDADLGGNTAFEKQPFFGVDRNSFPYR